MSSLRFKNFLITKEFKTIDTNRATHNQSTLLPLTNHEKEKYVEVASIEMVKLELLSVWRKAFILFMTTSYILCIIAADMSLVWLLSMINYIGIREKNLEKESELI
jgi:hypothetical protein